MFFQGFAWPVANLDGDVWPWPCCTFWCFFWPLKQNLRAGPPVSWDLFSKAFGVGRSGVAVWYFCCGVVANAVRKNSDNCPRVLWCCLRCFLQGFSWFFWFKVAILWQRNCNWRSLGMIFCFCLGFCRAKPSFPCFILGAPLGFFIWFLYRMSLFGEDWCLIPKRPYQNKMLLTRNYFLNHSPS